MSPAKVKDALMTTGLPKEVLRSVWELSDLDKGELNNRGDTAVRLF